MSPSRVLFVLHSDVRAGLEEHVLSLLEELDPGRFSLGLACPSLLIDAMQSELGSLPVELFPIDPIRWSRPRLVARLWKTLRSFRPHIVHCHLFRATFVAAPLARLAGVPVVVETYHGAEIWRRDRLGSFLPDRFIASFVDRVIAVSAAAANFLVERKGIHRDQIEVIANGRDLSIFTPISTEIRSRKRRELGIPEDAPVLGVIGRLEEQKGHEYLLEAMPRILQDRPGVRLLLLGDGALRQRLHTQAKALGIDSSVVFAGFQNPVAPYVGASDIVVLPSLYEGLPLAAIEAAAMGKAVIASDIGGMDEVVVDGETGILVPPANAETLADAALRLLREPALAQRFGNAALKRAAQHFDVRTQVAATERLYLNLLARRSSTQ